MDQFRRFELPFSNLRKSCGAAARVTPVRFVPFSSTRPNIFWQRNPMHLWARRNQSSSFVLSQTLWCRCHGIILESSSTSSVRPVTLWQRYQIPSFGFGNMVLLAHTNATETMRIACSGFHVWLAGLTPRSTGPSRKRPGPARRHINRTGSVRRLTTAGPVNFFR